MKTYFNNANKTVVTLLAFKLIHLAVTWKMFKNDYNLLNIYYLHRRYDSQHIFWPNDSFLDVYCTESTLSMIFDTGGIIFLRSSYFFNDE